MRCEVFGTNRIVICVHYGTHFTVGVLQIIEYQMRVVIVHDIEPDYPSTYTWTCKNKDLVTLYYLPFTSMTNKLKKKLSYYN